MEGSVTAALLEEYSMSRSEAVRNEIVLKNLGLVPLHKAMLNAQTSLGTTRFFLSIHLPHLSYMIPCSYLVSTCGAVLPSCMTSYEISVRQTRDLPVS